MRDIERLGFGWLPGESDIGERRRLGGFEGFRAIFSVTPYGVVTWFAVVSAKDQPLEDVVFSLRREPRPGFGDGDQSVMPIACESPGEG